jgi:hypothetical protein
MAGFPQSSMIRSSVRITRLEESEVSISIAKASLEQSSITLNVRKRHTSLHPEKRKTAIIWKVLKKPTQINGCTFVITNAYI